MAILPKTANFGSKSPMTSSYDVPPVIFATNSSSKGKYTSQINTLRKEADRRSPYIKTIQDQAHNDILAGYSSNRISYIHQTIFNNNLSKLDDITQAQYYSGTLSYESIIKQFEPQIQGQLTTLLQRQNNVERYLAASDVSKLLQETTSIQRQKEANQIENYYENNNAGVFYAIDKYGDLLYNQSDARNLAVADQQFINQTDWPDEQNVFDSTTSPLEQTSNLVGKTIVGSKRIIQRTKLAAKAIKKAGTTFTKKGVQAAAKTAAGKIVGLASGAVSGGVGTAVTIAFMIPDIIKTLWKNKKYLAPFAALPIGVLSFLKDPFGTIWRLTMGQTESAAAAQRILPPGFTAQSTPTPTVAANTIWSGKPSTFATPIIDTNLASTNTYLITQVIPTLKTINLATQSTGFFITTVISPFLMAGLLTVFTLTVILTSFTVPNPQDPNFEFSAGNYVPNPGQATYPPGSNIPLPDSSLLNSLNPNLKSAVTQVSQYSCMPPELFTAIIQIEAFRTLSFSDTDFTKFDTYNWWKTANVNGKPTNCYSGYYRDGECQQGYCYDTCNGAGCAPGAEVRGVAQFEKSTFYGSCSSPEGLDSTGQFVCDAEKVPEIRNYYNNQTYIPNRCRITDSLVALGIKTNERLGRQSQINNCSQGPQPISIPELCAIGKSYCGSCGQIVSYQNQVLQKYQPCLKYYDSSIGDTDCGEIPNDVLQRLSSGDATKSDLLSNAVGHCNKLVFLYTGQIPQ